jgi:hypothetical protein
MGITTAYKVADLTTEQLEQYGASFANGFTLTYLKEDGSTEVVQSSTAYNFMGTSVGLYAKDMGQVFLAVDPFSMDIGHADNYVNEAGIYFKEETGTNPYKVIKLEFQKISGELKILEPQFLTNSPGIKVKEGESYTSNEDYQTYVAQNNAEIFNDILNMATGQYSHAEGTMTEAHGNYSHAEGNRTFASGDYSHAEGGYTVASGTYSHAESGNTIASGMYSHAEGDCTEASGESSHVEGRYTVAAGECQHVQGKYNIPDPDNKYAHIVGNGSYKFGGNDVSNAHTLDWNGNAWFQGNVSIDGAPTNDNDLTTKEYVDSHQAILDFPGVDASGDGINNGIYIDVENLQVSTFYKMPAGKQRILFRKNGTGNFEIRSGPYALASIFYVLTNNDSSTIILEQGPVLVRNNINWTSRTLTTQVINVNLEYEPTQDYHTATKKYVDEAIANASLGNGSDVSDSGVIEDSEFDDLISGTFGPEYVNREE